MSDDSTAAAGFERVSLDDLEGQTRTPLFEGEPKTVLLALDADESVPPHQHPDRDIVLSVRSGTLALTLNEETVSLSAGDTVRFDGDQDISPRGETDCEALLVLAPSN